MSKTWCLTKNAEEKLIQALKEDGDPQKMVDRGSEGRLKWFGDLLGEENARNLNALFEEKMLLKSQINGFKSFIKRVGGSPKVQRDFLSRLERLKTALTKGEVDQYLQEYVQRKLGIEPLTENQFKVVSDLSNKVSELTKDFDPKEMKWKSEDSRKMKGALQVELEKYVQELKDGKTLGQIARQRGTQFKEEFVKNPARAILNVGLDSAKEIANTSVSLVASMDNSLFGRQGILTLISGHPKIWFKNFIKSFDDIAKTFGGEKTTDTLLSELYSDPLYMNGEYQKAKIIDVVDEQYPTSLPRQLAESKFLPLKAFGKGFEASEAAFKNGSLRMRTELYKMIRNAKEAKGIEMTDEEIIGTGKVVNSLLARGDLGRQNNNPIVRFFMWAPKMLKADLDVITAHQFSDIPKEDRKTALKNLATIVAVSAVIESVASALGAETELDPRSSDFLKVDKKYGFLRGIPQLITLASRLMTGTYKNKNGEIIKYEPGFGKQSRMDAVVSFVRGKAPPATGAIWDQLAGQDYQGNVPTMSSVLMGKGVPISIQNLVKLSKDPSTDNAIGVVADFFGLNANLNPESNIQSEVIPENTVVKPDDLFSTIEIYAKALGADPEDAINKFLSGQKIIQVNDGGIIVVKRQSVEDSQKFKKEWVESHGGSTKDIKEVKLDHVVPNKLGGSELEDNWAVIPTSVWSMNTKVENTLIKAVKEGKISKKEAQNLIKEYKNPSVDSQGNVTEDPDKELGEEIIQKYK